MIEVMFEKYGFDSAYIAIQVRIASSLTCQKFLRMLLGKVGAVSETVHAYRLWMYFGNAWVQAPVVCW